ncbi:MAG TPA: hypothetical protein VGG39_15455 [Polyangiaceae bacterium]|jgi:predicted methyltransferase
MSRDVRPLYGAAMQIACSLRFRRICVRALMCATTCLLPLLLACGSQERPAARPSSVAPAASAATARAVQAAAVPSKEGARGRDEQNVSALYGPESWNASLAAAELARWTPAMHVEAKALADATYPSGKAAIEAAMKGTHRVPGAADRDRVRHPAETMAFFGLEPTMTVLDVDPGTGWYTELLAPALAKQGRYLATGQYLPKPADEVTYARSPWSAFVAARFAAFLAKAPEVYGKVERIKLDYSAPKLAVGSGTVDMVLMIREVHMMRNWGTLGTWLAETLRVLKPGGILGIVDHRATPDAAPEKCANFGPGGGRLPEAWVIAQAKAAGFSLVGTSEVNANPKDAKDYEKGVWTLPPEFALGDKDHDRYAAIGESDRMTLKFVKPR